jgi:hypothetical protein
LSNELFEYISNNREKYKDELYIYNELKNAETVEFDADEIVRKIHKKLYEYEASQEIVLTKINISNNSDINYFLPQNEDDFSEYEQNIETFSDSNSVYLAKVLSTSKQNSIYIFSKKTIELRDFEITIKPSNKKYTIESSTDPLTIISAGEITEIILCLHDE